MSKAARLINLLEQKKNDKPSKIDQENLGIDLKDFELVPAMNLKESDRVLLINPYTGKWGCAGILDLRTHDTVRTSPVNIDFELPSGQKVTNQYQQEHPRGQKMRLKFFSLEKDEEYWHVVANPDDKFYRYRGKRKIK